MDTAPLPRIRDDRPARGALRLIEVIAGLLSAGLLLVGLALVALQLLAGHLAPGSGLSAASGPTWPRALAQLGAGVLGEIAVLLRPRLSHAARTWTALAIVIAAGAVLWLCWWA